MIVELAGSAVTAVKVTFDVLPTDEPPIVPETVTVSAVVFVIVAV